MGGLVLRSLKLIKICQVRARTIYLKLIITIVRYRSSWQGEEGIATKQASRERLAEMLDLLRVISCIVLYASLYK